jgi:hypothetical protein
MMERDFFNENFEWFLRRNADDLKMDASEKVWNGIEKELKRRRRRINLSLAASFIITSTVAYFLVTNSVKELPNGNVAKQTTITTPVQKSYSPKTFTDQTTAFNSTITKESKVPTNKSNYQVIEDAIPFREREAATPIDGLIANNNTESSLEDLTAGSANNIALQGIDAVQSIQENDEPEPINKQPILADEERVAETAPLEVNTSVKAITGRSRKLQWSLSFTPTISYRKLGENKSYLRSSSLLSAPSTIAPLYSVNSAVTHKPDLGFEVGLMSKYSVTKGIKLLGGVQFNINRYDIKAFNVPYSVATIRLNPTSGPSSVATITGLSNTGGYHTNWLKNFYFQVSAPLGVELKLAGDDKMQFGMATSVQPSYVLGDRAYLITSDYKNYVQVPWLIRRWNANTNLQTFVSYSTGKMKWQVGPQVRYQLLSSFVSKYPVKENLFDFGMKVGISLTK